MFIRTRIRPITITAAVAGQIDKIIILNFCKFSRLIFFNKCLGECKIQKYIAKYRIGGKVNAIPIKQRTSIDWV